MIAWAAEKVGLVRMTHDRLGSRGVGLVRQRGRDVSGQDQGEVSKRSMPDQDENLAPHLWTTTRSGGYLLHL